MAFSFTVHRIELDDNGREERDRLIIIESAAMPFQIVRKGKAFIPFPFFSEYEKPYEKYDNGGRGGKNDVERTGL